MAKGVGVLQSALSETMAQVPNLKMLWMGEGEALDQLLQGASARGHRDRNIFAGWKPDMESYYAAMDFLIAPSIEAETFGRMVVEAQSQGIPVIASTAGGLPEAVLDGKTGILIPCNDVVALATAVRHLAVHATMRTQFGENGRRFVLDNFSSPKICREFVACLESADRSVDVALVTAELTAIRK
jgi:glycosyltransferase involved in cell wall biosynthesis